MFGIGLPEMILILALALIVVGPDKLPELARSIAKGVLELKKTVSTLKEEFANENPLDTVKPELEEMAGSIKKQLGDTGSDGWDTIIDDKQPSAAADGQQGLSAAQADQTSGTLIDVDTADNGVSNGADSGESEQPEARDAGGSATSGEQAEEQSRPEKPAE